MHSTRPHFLLMIEPRYAKSATPDRDWATKKMTRLLNAAERINPTFGWHTCVCGAKSDCCEWRLRGGLISNNLAVHYLTWHRSEVPAAEMMKLFELPEPEIANKSAPPKSPETGPGA